MEGEIPADRSIEASNTRLAICLEKILKVVEGNEAGVKKIIDKIHRVLMQL